MHLTDALRILAVAPFIIAAFLMACSPSAPEPELESEVSVEELYNVGRAGFANEFPMASVCESQSSLMAGYNAAMAQFNEIHQEQTDRFHHAETTGQMKPEQAQAIIADLTRDHNRRTSKVHSSVLRATGFGDDQLLYCIGYLGIYPSPQKCSEHLTATRTRYSVSRLTPEDPGKIRRCYGSNWPTS